MYWWDESKTACGSEFLVQTFAQVDELVTSFFQKYPKEELYVEGQKLRLLIGTVNGPQELSESEQLNDRNWFRTINDTGRGRELRYPGPPWQLKATPATLSRPAPLLGEHNDEILRAIGLGKSEIMELSESGVIWWVINLLSQGHSMA